MKFMSLEEFDRVFFSRYAPGGAQGGGPAVDPFLREAGPPAPQEDPQPQQKDPMQILNTVIGYAVIALLVAGILGFAAPLAFGVKLLNVTSGSMQPDYPVNSLLWVVPTKYEKINIGDDVTYTLPTGQNSTHRVIDLDRAQRTLTVQGIYNSDRAELIESSQIQGVVRFHVHGLGKPLEAFTGESRVFIVIALILAILLLWGGTYFLGKMKAGQLNMPRRDTTQ